MNNWHMLRLALVAFAFLASALTGASSADAEDTPASMLFAVFFFPILGVLFTMGLQRVNPSTATFWTYPSWMLNPFQLKHPLQFFHFAGCFVLAAGLGGILRELVLGGGVRLNDWSPAVFGAGIWCGVRLSTLAFRGKMMQAHSG